MLTGDAKMLHEIPGTATGRNYREVVKTLRVEVDQSVGVGQWRDGLYYRGYDNDVARIIGNAVRRFLVPEPLAPPL